MAEDQNKDMQPCCLFASCGFENEDKLIKDLMNLDTVPSYGKVVEDIVGCNWDFETKYYTCSIKLCKTNKPTLGSQEFAEALEAVVLSFHPDQIESWNQVVSWLSYLEHLDPSVKLLVCNSCTEQSQVPRLEIQQWCIKHEFELIELHPLVNDEDEDDQFEVDGITRIRQVLFAHTWSNLVMKDKPDTISPYMKQLMDETKQEQLEASSQSSGNLDIHAELGMHAEELNKAMNAESDDGLESFEKLFSKFQLMKAKAESLPADERKNYAEKIAMSFYAAIGGSDDEIDSLGDSD